MHFTDAGVGPQLSFLHSNINEGNICMRVLCNLFKTLSLLYVPHSCVWLVHLARSLASWTHWRVGERRRKKNVPINTFARKVSFVLPIYKYESNFFFRLWMCLYGWPVTLHWLPTFFFAPFFSSHQHRWPTIMRHIHIYLIRQKH